MSGAGCTATRDRDEGEWRRRFARLRKSGVEAVLVGGGDIDLVSGAARAEGLEYHRWFWTMNRNGGCVGPVETIPSGSP